MKSKILSIVLGVSIPVTLCISIGLGLFLGFLIFDYIKKE